MNMKNVYLLAASTTIAIAAHEICMGFMLLSFVFILASFALLVKGGAADDEDDHA